MMTLPIVRWNMITPVNSITIPPQFVAVAQGYYGGIDDLLYAVASTGNLTTGTNRPIGCDGGPASDEEWYWTLWSELVDCIDDARDCALHNADLADRNGECSEEYLNDYATLSEFAVYAKRWADRLYAEYALEALGV